MTHIHDIISHLLELGPSLLDPAPHNRSQEPDHADAALNDINHVRDTFPKADDGLVERLGRANWNRRQYLRKLRFTALDQPTVLRTPYAAKSGLGNVKDTLSASAHRSHPASKSENYLPTSQTLTVLSASSESFFSRNEPQSTAMTEFTMDGAQEGKSTQPIKTRYKVPPPPAPNHRFSGEPFLCPFCALVISGVLCLVDWE